jgi:hypothetical protein
LDRAIEHGKEHREPYRHSGRFDWTCRPHGRCPWCYMARKGRHLLKLAEWTRAVLLDEGEGT